MTQAFLQPTPVQTYTIEADPADKRWDFAAILRRSRSLERQGDIEGACNMRFQAFQRLERIIPENEETPFEWNDERTQAALVLIESTAIDHFLIGDWEMCAAMLELLLELDPEDHLEATIILAYDYLAMEEYDSFDEVINDISDRHADKELLTLWSEYRRNGSLPEGEVREFKRRFAPYFEEFIAAEHPVDEEYLRGIEAERPTPRVLARELWLQTEHLWSIFPGFVEELGKH